MAKRAQKSPDFRYEWPDKPIYGVKFTRAGEDALRAAVIRKMRLDKSQVSHLLRDAMQAFAYDKGIRYNDVFGCDAYFYLCEQIDIDYRQFEHNIPFRAITPFVSYAKTIFTDFDPKANSMVKSFYKTRVIEAWNQWAERECKRLKCPYDHHSSCDEEYYGRPDYDLIIDTIVKQNRQKSAVGPKTKLANSTPIFGQGLRLVHSRD